MNGLVQNHNPPSQEKTRTLSRDPDCIGHIHLAGREQPAIWFPTEWDGGDTELLAKPNAGHLHDHWHEQFRTPGRRLCATQFHPSVPQLRPHQRRPNKPDTQTC